ncbi:hypothetical protein AB4Z50_16885 [Paenibacillus sp. 2TAB26]|uniref:hypothetical protein n=1 Tax=Paenibacillus sp. 2TAB26 TaxID=3233005 RepID=UPI003F94C377
MRYGKQTKKKGVMRAAPTAKWFADSSKLVAMFVKETKRDLNESISILTQKYEFSQALFLPIGPSVCS